MFKCLEREDQKLKATGQTGELRRRNIWSLKRIHLLQLGKESTEKKTFSWISPLTELIQVT